jgi:uncharacterized protein (DUF1800 family)
MTKNNHTTTAAAVVEEQVSTATDSKAEATPTESQETFTFTPAALSVLGAALLAACGDSGSEGGYGGTPLSANLDANGIPVDPATASSATGSANVIAADVDVSSQIGGTRGNVSTNNNYLQSNPNAVGFNNFPIAYTPNDASRFLQQSQLNASDSEIAAVSATTFAAYLQQQYAKPIGQTGVQWLNARGYNAENINNYAFTTYPAEYMIWNQLFTSQDSMRKRMALGLSEFFVASLQSAEFNWRSHAYAHYWDILVRNAFGNFRQLLEDVTLSASMGYYLNTKGNQKENPATGRVPDENYGREVMQLFTIGLYKLNIDGSVQTDGSGKKLESYTQSDVTNIARVFTGYDFDVRATDRRTIVYERNSSGVIVPASYTLENIDSVIRPMALTESRHSTLAATFLGTTIPANTPGAAALKIALDTLFNHPNVGPFFGAQMIQRFVTSNPSPAYIARVAAAFNNNGAGVRGDLKAVWTAIFLDDEARKTYTVNTAPLPAPTDPAAIRTFEGRLNRNISDKAFGKLREPMLRFVQWGRTFGLGPTNAAYQYWKIDETGNASNSLGQSPLRSPSVFNFFRPGFIPPSSALAATNTTAPEFQLVNETTVGGYLNFMQNVLRSGFRSYRSPSVPEDSYPEGQGYLLHTAATYLPELAVVADASALVKRVNLLMAAGQISEATQALMITAINSMPVNSTNAATLATQKMDRVAAAVLMVMASSEYLIQK